MKNIIFILLFSTIISCQKGTNEEVKQFVTGTYYKEADQVDRKLDSLYNINVFNGFSATIVDSTGILYNRGFGYADIETKKKYTDETLLNIASISKVFIGVALLKATELGILNLDDPINDYLPFEVVNPNYPNVLITIRQLATHTSSIVDTDIYMKTCYINQDDKPIAKELKEKYELYYQNPSKDWMSLKEYLSKILTKDEVFYDSATFATRKPGELREYSNIGAALCALVIESAAKRPFYEFTKEHIFDPLKMTSTSWLFEDVDRSNYSKLYFDNHILPYYKILSYPDGGLITSSSDLGKFLVELIQGYIGEGAVLNSSSYEQFYKSQLDLAALNGKDGFNVGMFIDKELAYDVIGHTGGDPGTNTMMYFNTKTKKGRIILTNTDSQKEGSNEVFWGIWNALDRD